MISRYFAHSAAVGDVSATIGNESCCKATDSDMTGGMSISGPDPAQKRGVDNRRQPSGWSALYVGSMLSALLEKFCRA